MENGKWKMGFLILASVALLLPLAASAQQNGSHSPDLGIDRVASTLVLPEGDPRQIAVRLINVALQFLAIIVLVMVVWSGFMFLFSGGKAENMARAGAVMRNAIIGLIIILCSWAIVKYVISAFLGAINGTETPSSARLTDPSDGITNARYQRAPFSIFHFPFSDIQKMENGKWNIHV
jgi:hypothetical protein